MGASLLNKIIAEALHEEDRLPSSGRLIFNLGLGPLLKDNRMPGVSRIPEIAPDHSPAEVYEKVFADLKDKDPDRFNLLLHTCYLEELLFRYDSIDEDFDFREQQIIKNDISQFFRSLSYQEIFRVFNESSAESLKAINCMAACGYLNAESTAFIFDPFIRSEIPEPGFFENLARDPECSRFLRNLFQYSSMEIEKYEDEDLEILSDELIQRGDNLDRLWGVLDFEARTANG